VAFVLADGISSIMPREEDRQSLRRELSVPVMNVAGIAQQKVERRAGGGPFAGTGFKLAGLAFPAGRLDGFLEVRKVVARNVAAETVARAWPDRAD
jgi:hypothetical protein